MANEQVTQEELTKIQELNSEFNKAKMAIGDVELQKLQILNHIEGLKIQFSAHEKELIEKGFDGWVTTGSIDGYQYVDYAIFDDDIYDIKEAKINARGWTEYMPLDKAKQFLSSVCD